MTNQHPLPTKTPRARAHGLVCTALLVSASLWLGAAPAQALEAYTGGTSATGADPSIRGTAHVGPRIRVKVKSLLERKWENVVKQESEIGCSAAALATILTYYFDFPTTEREVLQALYSEALSRPAPNLEEDLLYQGFNLLHVRNVARSGGLVAAGFRVKIENLPDVRIPVITRVTIRGYDHFAVFRAARNGRVYIADPAFGNTVYRLADFEKIWSGFMMGFIRRGAGAVEDHLLSVQERDQTLLTWEEVSRIIDRLPVQDHTPVTGVDVVTTLSFFDFVRPQISGLRSVFPTLIINRREFGEDITF